MKKIINGKKYDTQTAKEICEEVTMSNVSNLPIAYDTLYKKRTGEFFMAHQTTGQSLWDRENYIAPVTEEEAKKFAESVMDGDEYERVFGEAEE